MSSLSEETGAQLQSVQAKEQAQLAKLQKKYEKMQQECKSASAEKVKSLLGDEKGRRYAKKARGRRGKVVRSDNAKGAREKAKSKRKSGKKSGKYKIMFEKGMRMKMAPEAPANCEKLALRLRESQRKSLRHSLNKAGFELGGGADESAKLDALLSDMSDAFWNSRSLSSTSTSASFDLAITSDDSDWQMSGTYRKMMGKQITHFDSGAQGNYVGNEAKQLLHHVRPCNRKVIGASQTAMHGNEHGTLGHNLEDVLPLDEVDEGMIAPGPLADKFKAVFAFGDDCCYAIDKATFDKAIRDCEKCVVALRDSDNNGLYVTQLPELDDWLSKQRIHLDMQRAMRAKAKHRELEPLQNHQLGEKGKRSPQEIWGGAPVVVESKATAGNFH